VLTDARHARGCFVFVLSILLELLSFHIVVIPELADLLKPQVAHDLAKQGAQALQLTT
jgi:hypothetical protein